MIAIYARHGLTEKRDDGYGILSESIRSWHNSEEYGECYVLGIYDPATKTMHIPENMDVAGKGRETVLEEKKASFEKFGLEITQIEFYDQSE